MEHPLRTVDIRRFCTKSLCENSEEAIPPNQIRKLVPFSRVLAYRFNAQVFVSQIRWVKSSDGGSSTRMIQSTAKPANEKAHSWYQVMIAESVLPVKCQRVQHTVFSTVTQVSTSQAQQTGWGKELKVLADANIPSLFKQRAINRLMNRLTVAIAFVSSAGCFGWLQSRIDRICQTPQRTSNRFAPGGFSRSIMLFTYQWSSDKQKCHSIETLLLFAIAMWSAR